MDLPLITNQEAFQAIRTLQKTPRGSMALACVLEMLRADQSTLTQEERESIVVLILAKWNQFEHRPLTATID